MNKLLSRDNYRLRNLRTISKLMIIEAKKYIRKENIDLEDNYEEIFKDSIIPEGNGYSMYRLCNLYGSMYMCGWYINRFAIRNRPIDGSEVKSRSKTLRGYTRFV